LLGDLSVSADVFVHLERSRLPSPAKWQQAIYDAGFPVELDSDFVPDAMSGWLPCKLEGADVGFEYYANNLSPEEAHEVEAPAKADFCVFLSAHSDVRNVACAAIVAAALAKCSGGELTDPQLGKSFAPDDALVWAAAQLAETREGWLARLIKRRR
jgi:hypothetical protein